MNPKLHENQQKQTRPAQLVNAIINSIYTIILISLLFITGVSFSISFLKDWSVVQAQVTDKKDPDTLVSKVSGLEKSCIQKDIRLTDVEKKATDLKSTQNQILIDLKTSNENLAKMMDDKITALDNKMDKKLDTIIGYLIQQKSSIEELK